MTNVPLLPIRLYLGGSFDPPHCAHLAMLNHVYQTLANLPSLVASPSDAEYPRVVANFLPTARSPFKTQSTAPKHRLAMLQLACNQLNQQAVTINPNTTISEPNATPFKKKKNQNTFLPFAVCEHELWQPPPTYSIDTLSALRDKYPHASLVFVLGADSVVTLAHWRDGDRLTEFAHLWIMPRDALQTPDAIRAVLPTTMQPQATQNLRALQQTTHGRIYIDTQPVAAISSSQIRQAIAQRQQQQQQHDLLKSALPHSVYSYIMANHLYQ